MATNCTIPSNSDIAGIGVRVSLYGQALLAIVPLFLLLLSSALGPESKDSSKLKDDIRTNAMTVLFTGCALFISTFVQAARYGFDVYHALIVFNLSWLNNLSALFPAIVGRSEEEVDNEDDGWRVLRDMLPYILHLSGTGAYGIWLFSRIDNFGLNSECNSSIHWISFGMPVSATSVWLRVFFIAVSSIAVIPILNFWGLCKLWGFIFFFSCGNVYVGLLFTVVLFTGPSVLIIVSTEQLVASNRPLIQEGEDDWTFGQTLSLLLLVYPLWVVVSRLWSIIHPRTYESLV